MKRFTETNKWDDPWFRELKGAWKLVFLYIIDRCNNAGFWEVDEAAIAWHTKLTSEHVSGALKGLERGLKGANGWVWVKNFLRHQKNEVLNESNPAHKQIILLLKDQASRFSECPDFILFTAAFKGLLSPIGNGKVKERKGCGEGKPPKDKATAEQVAEFFKTEELSDADAEWFFEKCNGNGWTNSGNPILDWKATVRSWRAAGYLPSQKNGSLPKEFLR